MSEVEGFKEVLTAAVLVLDCRRLGMTREEYALLSLWNSHKAMMAKFEKLQALVMPTQQGVEALERFLKSRGVSSPLARGKK